MLRSLFGRGKDESEEKEAPTETPKQSAFQRLKNALSKTRKAFTQQIAAILRVGRAIDEEVYEELEEALICADAGVETTLYLMERLRETAKETPLREAPQLLPALKAEIAEILGAAEHVNPTGASPYVILAVGVNGVGKTTTIGKLAARYTSQGMSATLAAGDTFRAAAAEQLEIWSERAGAAFIRQQEGADPASVVYDAIHSARARRSDLLIIDTAGRQHTRANLMQELEKIARVAGRELDGAPHETLLVLDATTGHNAIQQGKRFLEAVPVTGAALTKLDGSAKGGVAVAVKREVGIPIKLVGVGEGIEDLRDFEPSEFVDALFEQEA